MSNRNTFTNKLLDRQTGRGVSTTALTNFALAGWVNFQDSEYTTSNKLTLPQDTPIKVTFTQPTLFSNFEREPQIGATKYPMWDFDNSKFISYEENLFGCNTTRIQVVAEAATASTGVAIEISLVIPTSLTIYRVSKPIVKGTSPQRIIDTMEFFYDQNTIDNGCEIYLTAIGDDIDVYNISMFTKNW